MSFDFVALGIIIAASIVLFALEIFPADKVSVLILGSLIATGLVSPSQATSGFSNAATITVACMLILSLAIEQSGVLNYAAQSTIRLAGNNEYRTLMVIILGVGVLSAFINNTAAVALFLPLTLAVARSLGMAASRFLMPMSFAAVFAGTCTLIGTSTNLIVSSAVQSSLDWHIGMFEFSSMGLVFFFVGTVYLFTIGRTLLPSHTIQESLTQEYHLESFVTELVIGEDSPLVGKTIVESRLGELYEIDVLEIIRGKEKLLATETGRRLRPGDILLVEGRPEAWLKVRRQEQVTIKALKLQDKDLTDTNIVLVEAFLSFRSQLIGKTLKQVNFRNSYKSTAVAIRSHEGRTINEKIGATTLEYGDSLLILTTPEQKMRLSSSPDFLFIEEITFAVVKPEKAIWAGSIFAFVIALATLGTMEILEASMIGVALMLLTRCLTLRDIYAKMSWQTIILLGCMIPMGAAMQSTGMAEAIGSGMTRLLMDWGPVAVLSGLYLLTSILTSVMSNNATAVLMVPIALSVATTLQVDPKALVMAIMFGASASFMTPIGYQTHLFVFGPGNYKFSDFIRVGTPLNLIFWILATILLPIFWPMTSV